MSRSFFLFHPLPFPPPPNNQMFTRHLFFKFFLFVSNDVDCIDYNLFQKKKKKLEKKNVTLDPRQKDRLVHKPGPCLQSPIFLSPPCVSPFSSEVIFTRAYVSLALLSLRKNGDHSQSNAILMLSWGGAFAHFLMPHHGVLKELSALPWDICIFSKRKTNAWGRGDGHACN